MKKKIITSDQASTKEWASKSACWVLFHALLSSADFFKLDYFQKNSSVSSFIKKKMI